MDKELQMYGYDLTVHKITQARLINLTDEEGKIVLTVPMEMFAVTTFFRCLVKQKTLSIPAHKMFLDVMDVLGGKMQKVVIDDLQGGRFFATLYFTDRDGKECTMKAEASDALAMAFRAPCYMCVRESVVDAAKNDRANRVYWYSAEDKESLKAAQEASHEELAALPSGDLKQLLEIATEIEDFEFAARIKRAMNAYMEKCSKMESIINAAIAEEKEKMLANYKKSLEEKLRDLMNDDIDS
jgi:bifunctional DNase/RNase